MRQKATHEFSCSESERQIGDVIIHLHAYNLTTHSLQRFSTSSSITRNSEAYSGNKVYISIRKPRRCAARRIDCVYTMSADKGATFSYRSQQIWTRREEGRSRRRLVRSRRQSLPGSSQEGARWAVCLDSTGQSPGISTGGENYPASPAQRTNGPQLGLWVHRWHQGECGRGLETKGSREGEGGKKSGGRGRRSREGVKKGQLGLVEGDLSRILNKG